MKYKLTFIAGVVGSLIGVIGIILVIIAVAFYHNEPIPPVNFLELLILLICCFLGFSNSLIGFALGEKNALIIYFIPLGLPLMTLLTGEMEPKIGALIHISVIEAVFIWIAGSIGMHLKKYSTNEQNANGTDGEKTKSQKKQTSIGVDNVNPETQRTLSLNADIDKFNASLIKKNSDSDSFSAALRGAWISIDRNSNPNARVAILHPPTVPPNYPPMWGIGGDWFWEDYAALSLQDAIFPIADCGDSTLIVNLSAMSRHSFYAYRVIDEAWLRLAERGKALVLVFSDDSKVVKNSNYSTSDRHDLAYELELHGLRAKCAIARTVQDALTLASVNPIWHPLNNEAVNQLKEIQQRLHELIKMRVGHLWNGATVKYPEVSRLYRAGIDSGCFSFPYGNLSWEFVGTGKGLVLEYKDYARVADGWGCRYEISSESTKLIESGLD